MYQTTVSLFQVRFNRRNIQSQYLTPTNYFDFLFVNYCYENNSSVKQKHYLKITFSINAFLVFNFLFSLLNKQVNKQQDIRLLI